MATIEEYASAAKEYNRLKIEIDEMGKVISDVGKTLTNSPSSFTMLPGAKPPKQPGNFNYRRSGEFYETEWPDLTKLLTLTTDFSNAWKSYRDCYNSLPPEIRAVTSQPKI